MAEKKKTPLQDEKEKKLVKLLDNKAEADNQDDAGKRKSTTEKVETVTEKPKKKKAYTRKKKVVAPPPDPEQLKKEGMFFIDLMSNGRKSMGIEKPIAESSQVMFVNSYAMLIIKYGDIATKWMPEVLMGTCLVIIGFDTLTEYKKIRLAEKKAKEDKKPELKPELSVDEQMGVLPEPEPEKAL